jgi:lysyl-tRNA synthetase class 1
MLDDEGYLSGWQYTGHNLEAQTMSYESKKDPSSKGEISYTDGRVFLNWRVDWPARWSLLPVDVEPFGRDHATKGGSYDTGKAIVENIFQSPAPIPFPYEFINLKGHTKKMSASKGTGILPLDALKVMSPAQLKYTVMKDRPSLQLFFDMGQGFGKQYDDFAADEKAFQVDPTAVSPMSLAVGSASAERVTTDVPFNHLVVAWQSAQKDADRALEILQRSEHAESAIMQADTIKVTFEYVENWLNKWAPEELKFVVQQEVPDVELDEVQRKFLAGLADAIEQTNNKTQDGEWYHAAIHELRESYEMTPKHAFQAIYQSILAKDSGPKAGWFLSTFDSPWLVERFRACAHLG